VTEGKEQNGSRTGLSLLLSRCPLLGARNGGFSGRDIERVGVEDGRQLGSPNKPVIDLMEEG
jgi:hypothetical protein